MIRSCAAGADLPAVECRGGRFGKLSAGLVVVIVVAAGLMAVTGGSAYADWAGSTLYAGSADEHIAYNRVIRLRHGGSHNGTLLATFEHTERDGSPSAAIIRHSTDDGATWSTLAEVRDGLTGPGHPSSVIYQPFLFEFPRQIGSHPAGTLLLAANVVVRNGPAGEATVFQLWRSTDHGASWTFVTVVQQGGGGTNGIWEPFLDVDGDGNLVTYFADERRSAFWSQFIGHVVSRDGGETWSANPDGSTRHAPGLVGDVASGVRTDRPGMPTVATLADGTRVMAYELCGEGGGPPLGCDVFTKFSTDGGRTWGRDPGDLGTRPETTDGRYLTNSPYIAFSQSGQLLLTGMRARLAVNGSLAPEDHQMVLVNPRGGTGLWNWTPSPFAVAFAEPTSSCYPNYSPNLLPSVDGSDVRLTTPSAIGASGCEERTGSANSGVLPYRASFGGGTDAGWKTYGGCWSVRSGEYRERCGGLGGNKSLTGSTGWTDYTVAAEVQLTSSSANPGVLVRVTNPHTGTDAHDGYFLGATVSGIVLGRQRHSWTPLATRQVDIPVGSWYRLGVRVVGCTFTITGGPVGPPGPTTTLTHTDTGCTMTNGMVGVRDFDGAAGFRDFTVTAA